MIKRPFALAGFSFVYALLALNLIHGSAAVVAAAAAVCLLLCAACKNLSGRKTYAVSMLCVLAACACFQSRELFVLRPALDLTGENIQVSGEVVSEVRQNGMGSCYCTVKTDSGYRIRLGSSENISAQIGDTVSLCGKVYEIGGEHDDVQTYYKAKNIFLGCRANGEITVTQCAKRPAAYYFSVARAKIVSSLTSLLPGDVGAVSAAMITGDKTAVSGRVNSAFSVCGLSHILAVSGVHMSILVFALYSLLRRVCGRFRRLPAVCGIVAALLYAGLAGFTPSASRACVMVCVMFAGKLFARKSDALNSLGLAALLLALINPYAVLDLSYMLSFSATLGIVLFAAALTPKFSLPRVLALLASALCSTAVVTVVATVFCLPVYIMMLGSISLVSLPANLLTFFAVPAILVFGLLSVVTGVFGRVFAFVCGLFCKHILAVVARLSAFDSATLSLNGFSAKLWLGCTLIVAAAALLMIRSPRRSFRFCAVFVCASIIITGTVGIVENRNRITVSALNVTNGYCFVVSSGSRAVLIGGGGNDYYDIGNGLDALGVKTVELLLLPRHDRQDMASAEYFLKNNFVALAVLPERDTVENLAENYRVTQNFCYDFCGARIKYECSGGYAVCRLEAEAGSVLFTFSADTPAEMLTEADFLFSRAQPPTCLDTGIFQTVIVASSGSTALYSDNAYSTHDNGMLTLSFNSRGTYKTERY